MTVRGMTDAHEMRHFIALARNELGVARCDAASEWLDRLCGTIERTRVERDRLAKEHDKQMRAAQAAAHVIIETGVVPGIDSPCRCDECRYVAKELDDLGYLEDVDDADRWWMRKEVSDG